MTINATRVAFEKQILEIPFVNGELKSENPRFTLEWDDSKNRYKFIFIDTLFKVFEPMYNKLVELNSVATIEGVDVFSETEDEREVTLWVVEKILMDRWAPAPEVLGKIYFESELRAKHYISDYNAKNNTSNEVPDEYICHSITGTLEAKLSDFDRFLYDHSVLGVCPYYYMKKSK